MAVLRYGIGRYGVDVYGLDSYYSDQPGKIIWRMQVDWNNDGIFDDYEPLTFTKIKYFRGRKNRIRTDGKGQEQPERETFWVEIQDQAARYDPYNSGSPIYQYLGASGVRVRIRAISTTSWVEVNTFYGILNSVTYNAKTRRATLIGEGLARALQTGSAEYLYAPCQQLSNYGWDSYFLDNESTPYPVNYWRGRPNGLYLRECVAIVLDRASWNLPAYYGAALYNTDYPDYFYLSGESAWTALKNLADAFAARVLILRDGTLFIMDRQDTAGLGTLSAPGNPLIEFGLERPNPYEVLRNVVQVDVRNHAVRPFDSQSAGYAAVHLTTGWSNNGPIAVPPASSRDIVVEYISSGRVLNASFAAINSPETLGPTVYYSVWSKANGSGVDMGWYGGTSMAQAVLLLEYVGPGQISSGNNQSRSVVRLINADPTLTAYFFNLRVVVVAIQETGSPVIKTVEDSASIASRGRRQLKISQPWIQDDTMATNIGNAYLAALSEPENASPVTFAYLLQETSLYTFLSNYDLGYFVDFGSVGGATSQAHFGISGVWLIVAMEVETLNQDGETALIKITYERKA